MKSFSFVETFCNCPPATCWFVMSKPSGETKEPEPPSFKRTEARRRWSSQSCVGSKLYFSFHCLSGGLSNVHIPSSARGTGTKTKKEKIINKAGIFFISY